MMKTMVHSPALLEGYLAFSGALDKGVLQEVVRQQIALLVSQQNNCEYCLSAHTLIGRHAGLNREQVLLARQGQAQDAKQQSVLNLVQNILDWRGDVSSDQFSAAKDAGLSDAEIAEVVGHVALTTLTNYFNQLTDVDVDFPRVSANLEPNAVLQA
jgi:AhpD family alkylhydroperoxidase